MAGHGCREDASGRDAFLLRALHDARESRGAGGFDKKALGAREELVSCQNFFVRNLVNVTAGFAERVFRRLPTGRVANADSGRDSARLRDSVAVDNWRSPC